MRLLIEGWRASNQSLSIVNQFQALALLRRPDVTLFHRDLPAPFDGGVAGASGPGFPAEDALRLDKLARHAGEPVDAVYRIVAPCAAPADDARRTVSFMVTELGLGPSSFAPDTDLSWFTRDENLIVTPSVWSAERIVEAGFEADRVRIVPHGVDQTLFFPLAAEQRADVRARLGFRPDETVFLNIGGPFWNKGVDILLEAFALLRARGRRIRLVLKDQSNVYGMGMSNLIAEVGARRPELLIPETLGAISVISGPLDFAQMRELYAGADAYVSPYRAEGFNLPVLEAMACGAPVIVTTGGATDDFCPEPLAIRLPSQAGILPAEPGFAPRRFVQPRLEGLVEAMEHVCQARGVRPEGSDLARAALLHRFSWDRAVALMLDCAGMKGASPESAPAPRPLPPTQKQVLALLSTMRPCAMQNSAKLRIGNTYDGGYVLPEAALEADVLLSIGVGHDVTFDMVFARRGAAVLQFDHTLEQPPETHENFRFHRLGWGATTEGVLLSLADMHARVEALGAGRKLLKFDVEGAEYEALETVSSELLQAYDVIACELHDLSRLDDRVHFDRVRRALEKLTQSHAPVHLHANNYAGMSVVQGVPVPDAVELTLLRRDLDCFPGLSDEPMPGALDNPNNPMQPDLCFSAFA
jgi:glycosyltransferase involved in cell wall biosynthesis